MTDIMSRRDMNELIEQTIQSAIPDATVHVFSPDGTHFSAVVVSPAFEGLLLVKQHQMVMNALKAAFDSEKLHALQLRTFTPAKWQESELRHALP